ncbi:hypothetical protein I4F81_011734 [Pyropia yezoensis]|uniref:Uncharacterized protein n=1 Tax=Pyropia yezoensis TaxID=2788 RepID=A0ACC3CH34_PYRYE|nr:hypothetical protein I4F81_011734 [Neopyropia yezoensis]
MASGATPVRVRVSRPPAGTASPAAAKAGATAAARPSGVGGGRQARRERTCKGRRGVHREGGEEGQVGGQPRRGDQVRPHPPCEGRRQPVEGRAQEGVDEDGQGEGRAPVAATATAGVLAVPRLWQVVVKEAERAQRGTPVGAAADWPAQAVEGKGRHRQGHVRRG